MPPVPEQISKTIETLYRSESGRVLATLVRLLGDLDLAEEAMHEAFAAALESWPQTGIPDNPRPWLISTARFKAIDVMRRRARFDGAQRDLVAHMESRSNAAPLGAGEMDDAEIEDDRLRLIFTCCPLPRDRGSDAIDWWPGRLVNADANVGDALCQLNAWIHAAILPESGWSKTSADQDGLELLPNTAQHPYQSRYRRSGAVLERDEERRARPIFRSQPSTIWLQPCSDHEYSRNL